MKRVYELTDNMMLDCFAIKETESMGDFEGCAVLEAILRIKEFAAQAEAAYLDDEVTS